MPRGPTEHPEPRTSPSSSGLPEPRLAFEADERARRAAWRLQDHGADEVVDLPVESLGLLILEHLKESSDIQLQASLLLDARLPSRELQSVKEAFVEGWQWLLRMGALAPHPDQTNGWVVITRAGREMLKEGGLSRLKAADRLRVELHPTIAAESRALFLLGKYESAVFEAMKAVEIRVRRLGGYGHDQTGVNLMNLAFGSEKPPKKDPGPLTDPAADSGEQKAMQFLFAGAYGVLRNPPGHRVVDYDDVTEAAEAVLTASMLMRILDRIERRRSASTTEPPPANVTQTRR